MKWYIVNEKGEVLQQNGWLFRDNMAKAKSYKRESAARENAVMLARCYRMKMRLVDQEGNEVEV